MFETRKCEINVIIFLVRNIYFKNKCKDNLHVYQIEQNNNSRMKIYTKNYIATCN